MELIVKSRNGKITERQKAYIEEKLGKLERYLDQISQVTVEIGGENRRGRIDAVSRAQFCREATWNADREPDVSSPATH